ncbi:hypothetical protein V6N11_001290 [Hibiscus sabdariffa]|uniref:Uncharacterized protein n=1 Tax=Hibiscus sabdariffa TaxID=183260 RepID=A0ABR2RZC1_9ROSI
MTDSNQWHMSRLTSLFRSKVAQHILSIRCPESIDINDKCIWKLNPKIGLHWAKYIYGCPPPTSPLQVDASIPKQWKAPESGWYCHNVDGVVSLTQGLGSIGGLV